MKKIYKILILLIGFILITGLVYATSTSAKVRKSIKIPWQGTNSGFYDSAHNVGDSYIAESRFSFDSGTVGSGVVLDNITGLMWQSDGISTYMDWESAKSYCADLKLGLYTDWRLPNLKELQSIVDLSKSNPSIDNNYFNTNESYYWSSTLYTAITSNAFIVGFNGGGSGNSLNTTSNYVRCNR